MKCRGNIKTNSREKLQLKCHFRHPWLTNDHGVMGHGEYHGENFDLFRFVVYLSEQVYNTWGWRWWCIPCSYVWWVVFLTFISQSGMSDSLIPSQAWLSMSDSLMLMPDWDEWERETLLACCLWCNCKECTIASVFSSASELLKHTHFQSFYFALK